MAGLLVGLIPAMGWHPSTITLPECHFTKVIPQPYMVYISFVFGMLLPLTLMLISYVYIFKVVRRQINHILGLQVTNSHSAIVTRRALFCEAKTTKWLAGVLVLVSLCWAPIHIINTITYLDFTVGWKPNALAILLSHANSALNPILYAYTNGSFQQAFRRCILHQPAQVTGPVIQPSMAQHPQCFITAMLRVHMHNETFPPN